MTPEERMRLLRNEDQWTFALARRANPFPAKRQVSPWLVSLATIAAVAVVGVIVFSVFGLGIRSARPVAPPVVPTQSAVPTASPTPTATGPTATPTRAASAQPASRFAFTCDDLASDAEISDLVGTAVHAVDGLESPLSAYWSIPREGSIEQVGGLVCEWNNGVPYNSIAGTYEAGAPHIGFQVMLLPDAAAGYKKAGVTGDAYVGCNGKYCNSSSIIGSTWMQSTAQGVQDVDRTKAERRVEFRALEANIESVVAAAGAPAARADSTAKALPGDCAGYATDAEVSAAVGVPMSFPTNYGDGGGGGWSLEAEAMEQAAFGYGCLWGTKDTGRIVQLATLPAGAWIPTDYSTLGAPQGAASALHLDGLAATDSAWIRCDMQGSSPEDYCIVDLAIGGNWIELKLYPKEGGWEKETRPLGDVLTDVAQAVVTSLE